MTAATPKTSTVIITAPCVLTQDQRRDIVDRLQQQLPQDVGVVVLDGGITAQVLGDAFVSVDAIPGELLSDASHALILDELRGLRTDLACHHAELKHVGLRVTP